MKLHIITLLLSIILQFPLSGQAKNDQFIQIGIVELEYWGEKSFKTGELTGIYPDIFRELSKRLHLKTIIVLAPYPRIMHGVKTGNFDMTITLPDNDETIIIGEKVWTIRLGILSKKSNPVSSLDQLSGMKVGVIRGANFEPGFDADSTIDKLESVQHRNLLSMLENDHIDAIASDLTILNGLILQNGKSKDDYANQIVVNELSLHVIFSSASPNLHLLTKINETILEMVNDGTIKDIIFQHIE